MRPSLPHGAPPPHYTPPLQEELGSPALAFVRTACHLLALDSRVADAVAVLRRQLLKLLHVREFGPQADFREVCLGFTLPDVICRWASSWRIRGFCAWEFLCLGALVPRGFGAWWL